jgi:hypothetical protein
MRGHFIPTLLHFWGEEHYTIITVYQDREIPQAEFPAFGPITIGTPIILERQLTQSSIY